MRGDESKAELQGTRRHSNILRVVGIRLPVKT
jgi:hypothetical protein